MKQTVVNRFIIILKNNCSSLGSQAAETTLHMFLLLYFILRSVVAYRTVIVANGNAVCHCFNKPLSIYLSIYLSSKTKQM